MLQIARPIASEKFDRWGFNAEAAESAEGHGQLDEESLGCRESNEKPRPRDFLRNFRLSPLFNGLTIIELHKTVGARMRSKVIFLSRLVAISIVLLAGSAWAHPGHDHSVPSGVWQEHEAEDQSAGSGTSSLAAASVSAAASTISDVRITSWKLADGSNGSSNDATVDNVVGQYLADVNTVAYSDDYAFIRTTGIPSHEVGPFADGNPSIPGDVDATYRISCNPTEETGAKTATGLGSIGVMVNGAGFYNASDGTYWNPQTNGLTQPGGPPPQNTNWSTNALWYRAIETDGMDDGGGHPSPVNGSTNPDGSPLGFYHYHRSPIGLLDQIDPGNNGSMGSPIIGFAFDGYPVVGPFAYADDSLATTVQMASSYGVYADRSSLPTPQPTVTDYALGSFLEDFVYNDGSGNLNEYNMSFVKFTADGRAILTDETDLEGDWAYFATIDALDASSSNDITRDGDVAYPYIVGPEYFGVVDTIMTTGGQITVPGNVTYYFEYESADYDADTDIDGSDFLEWQLGHSPNALSSSDLLNWQNQYGSSTTLLSAFTAVPEPTSLALFCLIGLSMLRRRS